MPDYAHRIGFNPMLTLLLLSLFVASCGSGQPVESAEAEILNELAPDSIPTSSVSTTDAATTGTTSLASIRPTVIEPNTSIRPTAIEPSTSLTPTVIEPSTSITPPEIGAANAVDQINAIAVGEKTDSLIPVEETTSAIEPASKPETTGIDTAPTASISSVPVDSTKPDKALTEEAAPVTGQANEQIQIEEVTNNSDTASTSNGLSVQRNEILSENETETETESLTLIGETTSAIEPVSKPETTGVDAILIATNATVPVESPATGQELTEEAAPVTGQANEQIKIDELTNNSENASTSFDPPVLINETFSENENEDIEDSISITGCVGNLAWIDSNRDGVKSNNETGIAIDKIDLISQAGNIVDSTSTETGYYQLCSLPGNYTIRFEFPDGYEATILNAGISDITDSDASEIGEIDAEVIAGKNRTKYDIGLVTLIEPDQQIITNAEVIEESTQTVNHVEPTTTAQSPQNAIGTQAPVSTPAADNEQGGTIPIHNSNDDLRWGFWTETRNAYLSPLGDVDEGVETTFENYSFAHVKAKSLESAGGDTLDKEYVVNVLEAATRTNTALDLQLGSAGEYGWNFSTGRGNFNLEKWKASVSRFSADADPTGHSSIIEAIQNGTVRYIFLIDEPNHKRWSPAWDGSHGSSAPGDPNYVSNQDLDDMAAHVKSIFGNDTRTIVRTSPVNLITGARQGTFIFQHMTHAYLTISSTKWSAGSNKGANKGFEWFLTLKNNHTDNTTNLSAFRATNLQPSIMIQAGFQSTANPWTGVDNFKSQWWQDDIRYPYNGATGYIKTAPGEMDYWIKSLLSLRDPNTGILSDTGIRWVDEFVIFRADRLPTDSGRLPFSTYPHYSSFLDQLHIDLEINNLNPIIGIPVGWAGN